MREIFTTTQRKYICELRALTALDWIEAGELPTLLVQSSGSGRQHPEELKRMYGFFLSHGVVSFTENGIRCKIVDKDPFDCVSPEMSWREIPDPDQSELITKIIDISGVGVDAGAKIIELKKKEISP